MKKLKILLKSVLILIIINISTSCASQKKLSYKHHKDYIKATKLKRLAKKINVT